MRALLILTGSCVSLLPLYGRYLLLDRGLKNEAPAAVSPQTGFLSDSFKVGATGEVWVIDKIRVWGKVGTNGSEKVALFGGLENAGLAPGAIECDCHNLLSINREPQVSRLKGSVWQLDFDHLNWSVPGGATIQFGVSGPRWSTTLVNTGTPHQIKLFDANGKLVKPYGDPSEAGFAIQVWGHLPATIEIRSEGDLWRVKLVRAGPLAAARTDEVSLRFGPGGAKPVTIHWESDAVVIHFRSADTKLRPADLNACLSGRREDGVPFEGCDLLKYRPQ
jgi:hypothetical protein